jgi:hypothetical protein
MTLSDLSIYVIFEDPLQENNGVIPFSLPTTKAYVEFIDREKARAYLQYIYIVKSNNGSKENSVIQSNQDMYVCGYMRWICGG